MIAICVKNVSVAGPLTIRKPAGFHTTISFTEHGQRFTMNISVCRQAFIDVETTYVRIELTADAFIAFQDQTRRVAPRHGARITGIEGRLSASGILKIYYRYDFPDGATLGSETAMSDFGTAAIQDTEMEGGIYARIIEAITSSNIVSDQGELPLDYWRNPSDETYGQRYQSHVVSAAWHSIHLVAAQDEVDDMPWYHPDGSEEVTGVVSSYADTFTVALSFEQLEQNRGRFLWRLNADDLTAVALHDLLDVTTFAMDSRQIIDTARLNALELGSNLAEVVTRRLRLSAIMRYEVLTQYRLVALERFQTMVEPTLRRIWELGDAYYGNAERKKDLKEVFSILQSAVSARQQSDAERFSRRVTIIALAFTALSFVTTGIALVDYLDPPSQKFTEGERLLFLFLSFVPGALGLIVALVSSSRRTQR